MGSRPTFEPANFRNADPEVYNRNLPIWRTYEPGSTFKIITLAAALEENKVNLKEGFHDPGYIKVAGARLRCWKHGDTVPKVSSKSWKTPATRGLSLWGNASARRSCSSISTNSVLVRKPAST